jgi:hypothetical protein
MKDEKGRELKGCLNPKSMGRLLDLGNKFQSGMVFL